MVAIPLVALAFNLILIGALFRVFELKFKDSDNALGSAARVLAVIY